MIARRRTTRAGLVYATTLPSGKHKYYCRECRTKLACKRGGRCRGCYRKNPDAKPIQPVKPQALRPEDLPMPIIGPCPYMPGSPEKIAWLEGRIATGQPLWQRGDRTEMDALRQELVEAIYEEDETETE